MKSARATLSAADVVPPSGHTSGMTVFGAAVMAFVCVFALALAQAAGRMAERWENAMANAATIRLSAPAGQLDLQTERVLAILAETPGVASSRALGDDEVRALLAPWLGADLPIEELPLPRLVEIEERAPGLDAEGLRQRLAAEAPGAILDDHARWRRPLVEAAARIRLLGILVIGLIGGAMAAIVTLAASASLASNAQVIGVLRLVGARDTFIARAFVRRFTLRALGGAAAGTLAGMFGVMALPRADAAGGFLTGLGFTGAGWFWPLVLPPAAAAVAFVATRRAAFARLRKLS